MSAVPGRQGGTIERIDGVRQAGLPIPALCGNLGVDCARPFWGEALKLSIARYRVPKEVAEEGGMEKKVYGGC